MRLPKFSGLPKRLRYTLIVRRVAGVSMVPALRPQQIVAATAWSWQYVSGDVVILKHDGLDKIKRISGVRKVGRMREIFVIGDNQAASVDSRQFGWIPMSAVLGKVIWAS